MESVGKQVCTPKAGCYITTFVQWLLRQGRLNGGRLGFLPNMPLEFLHPFLPLDLPLFLPPHPPTHLFSAAS